MPFPPEKRDRRRRVTPPSDQAGYQSSDAAAIADTNSKLDDLIAALADPATETTLAAVLAKMLAVWP